ncbi:MAG: hypothetical protein EXS36_16415 [Pedosphaera sp.]|nr:hypothetical protein [Pedosphaera sp.]
MPLFLVRCLIWIPLCIAQWEACAASIRISELMASNHRTLQDEDGDSSDWFELENLSNQRVDLTRWVIRSDSGTASGWIFPATNLAPQGRLVVFASGKNRSTPGKILHTDFRLIATGGNLQLRLPDGGTIIDEIRYPQQHPDVSYGVGLEPLAESLITLGNRGEAWVPLDDRMGTAWTTIEGAAAAGPWIAVTNGVGYEDASGPPPGLLTFWNFNNPSVPSAIPDNSGYGYVGKVVRAQYGVDTSGRTGTGGDRALFLPGNALVDFSARSTQLFAMAIAHNAITLSLWIKGSASQPSPDSLFWAGSQADGGGTRSLNAHVPWSDRVVYWDTGCCDLGEHRLSMAVPDESLWRLQWNHYAFSKNGPVKQVWINGKLTAETVNRQPLAAIRSFYLGAGSAAGGSGYHGFVDDVSIWDRALTPAEIRTLARGTSPNDFRTIGEHGITDVGESLRAVSSSLYLRYPFSIDPDPVRRADTLQLRVEYNDGFIAYIDGKEVFRRNAPAVASFNAAALEKLPDGCPMGFEILDISSAIPLLKSGANVLAVQALNSSIGDPLFLFFAELTGSRRREGRFFIAPTPGDVNPSGTGGLVEAVQFTPPGGVLSGPMDVRLSTRTPGASLIYTLDTTVPSPMNGIRIDGPQTTVRINNTSTLRATAVLADFEPAPLETRTWLYADRVGQQTRPKQVPARWPDSSPADFEMDVRIFTNTLPGFGLASSLAYIPSVCLTLTQADLFGTAGLYPNATQRGTAWERPASLEWVNPDGSIRFHQNVGLEIHGNISRDNSFTPKHSFALRFRAEYGPARLNEPLFPGSPVRRFKNLILRGGSTDTWPVTEWTDGPVDGVLRWYRKDASYIRDQWVRDAQIDMGHASAHGSFVHVYLNGLYWGLYNLCEHPDENFAADHLGGSAEDYDVLNDFSELRSGTRAAWDQLIALSSRNLAQVVNYELLLGNHADGTRNPTIPRLLDVTNLVDYMILHIAIGADDWPNHNWWAVRSRMEDSPGFQFFAWDQEISINSLIKQHSSWGPLYASVSADGTPAYIYSRCRTSAEFRQLFADRVEHHLFGAGALTPSNNIVRWDRRIEEIDKAVVAESARWGDYRRPSKPYRREVEWMSNHIWMRQVFFQSNQSIAVRRFVQAGLYSTNRPPTLDFEAGSSKGSSQVRLQNPNATGVIYFTTNGVDPRVLGGGVSPDAISYTQSIPITGPLSVLARIRIGSLWSTPAAGRYYRQQDWSALQPSEIQYHPDDWHGIDGDEFEFIELVNTGVTPLQLAGARLTGGIQFVFDSGSILSPGEVCLLVRNEMRFRERYPGLRIVGVFDGKLANAGDTIGFRDPFGTYLWTIQYLDLSPWPVAADGKGNSLQRSSASVTVDHPTAWQAGPPTPGTAFTKPPAGSVLHAATLPLGKVELRWDPTPGQRYRLEQTFSLSSPDWQVVEQFAASDPVTTVWREVELSNGAARYYRLVWQ